MVLRLILDNIEGVDVEGILNSISCIRGKIVDGHRVEILDYDRRAMSIFKLVSLIAGKMGNEGVFASGEGTDGAYVKVTNNNVVAVSQRGKKTAVNVGKYSFSVDVPRPNPRILADAVFQFLLFKVMEGTFDEQTLKEIISCVV